MILIGQVVEQPSNFLPQILMFGGVMLAMFLVMSQVKRRYRSRQGSQVIPAGDKLERMKQERIMKNDLRTMMVELEELTRRFSSQLDAKSMQLEHVIAEAEAKVAELQGLLGQGHGLGTGGHFVQSPVVDEEAGGVVSELVNAGEAIVESTVGDEGNDPLKEKIYELDDGGRTSVEIATELGEHVGKVELILALRGQAKT